VGSKNGKKEDDPLLVIGKEWEKQYSDKNRKWGGADSKRKETVTGETVTKATKKVR